MGRYFEHAKKPRPPIPELLSVSWLHLFGWSDKMIRDFAGKPDRTRPNPHGGAPIRYWNKKQIQKIENTPEFAHALAAAARRRKAKNGYTSTPTYPDCVDPGAIVSEKF